MEKVYTIEVTRKVSFTFADCVADAVASEVLDEVERLCEGMDEDDTIDYLEFSIVPDAIEQACNVDPDDMPRGIYNEIVDAVLSLYL